VNINKLRGKIVENGYTVTSLAPKIGMDRATFYRKMKDQSFTVREAVVISKVLDLNSDEIMAIFFTQFVA